MRVYAPTSMERLDHVFLRSLPWRRRALFSAALASFRAATSFRFFSNASSLFWRKATGSKDPLPSADLCFLSSRFLIVLFVVFFPEGIERRAPMPAAANPRVLIFLQSQVCAALCTSFSISISTFHAPAIVTSMFHRITIIFHPDGVMISKLPTFPDSPSIPSIHPIHPIHPIHFSFNDFHDSIITITIISITSEYQTCHLSPYSLSDTDSPPTCSVDALKTHGMRWAR